MESECLCWHLCWTLLLIANLIPGLSRPWVCSPSPKLLGSAAVQIRLSRFVVLLQILGTLKMLILETWWFDMPHSRSSLCLLLLGH